MILGSSFRYQDKEISYRIFIKYVRGDIAWKFFRNNVKMKENKIQIFYIECNSNWKSLAHVIKQNSKYAVKRRWLPQLL